jgi:hypothetical protein
MASIVDLVSNEESPAADAEGVVDGEDGPVASLSRTDAANNRSLTYYEAFQVLTGPNHYANYVPMVHVTKCFLCLEKPAVYVVGCGCKISCVNCFLEVFAKDLEKCPYCAEEINLDEVFLKIKN